MKIFGIEINLFGSGNKEPEPEEQPIGTTTQKRTTGKLEGIEFETAPDDIIDLTKLTPLERKVWCDTCYGMRPIGHSCFND